MFAVDCSWFLPKSICLSVKFYLAVGGKQIEKDRTGRLEYPITVPRDGACRRCLPALGVPTGETLTGCCPIRFV